MIERLLPAAVATVEAFDDEIPAPLYPAEQAHVARSVPNRVNEFATARRCARQALGRLGVAPAPILPGLRGAPTWPEGIVGTMTHCSGYRAAAVARADGILSLGIDAEPHEPLPAGVFDVIASDVERDGIDKLPPTGTCWDRILFCAKESTYKTWYPLTSAWLDFREARVTIDPDEGTFISHLLVPGPVVDGRRIDGFDGRWLVDRGLILTAITLTRE